jgi:ribosomal protein S18 acetylase RimI-like enzyme
MQYRIVSSTENINSEEVLRLLKMTYWANNRTIEQIEESMASSFCYGLFLAEEERLVGFARVISDLATTYYLCDVIIDPEYQHQGLGKALVSHIISLPQYRKLRGILLTKDAHGLYEKYGFETVNDRAMVKAPEI